MWRYIKTLRVKKKTEGRECSIKVKAPISSRQFQADSLKQTVSSRQSQADSLKQTASSRQSQADSLKQTASSRQSHADSLTQTVSRRQSQADSFKQTCGHLNDFLDDEVANEAEEDEEGVEEERLVSDLQEADGADLVGREHPSCHRKLRSHPDNHVSE